MFVSSGMGIMYKSQVIIASINVTRIILHIVPCPFGLGAIKGLGLVLCRLYFSLICALRVSMFWF